MYETMGEYWREVFIAKDVEWNGCIDREKLFRETKNESVLEGQSHNASDPTGGLFMMSLKSLTKRTVGGQVSSVPWKTVGCKIVDGTHRRATAEEIKKFKREENDRHAAALGLQDSLDSRRVVIVKSLEPRTSTKGGGK